MSVRERKMADARIIYFDYAATAYPKIKQVNMAMLHALEHFSSPGRGGYGPSLDAGRAVYRTRKGLAKLFNAEAADTVAFTGGATASLNLAIQGLLAAGDHVITTVAEHNSVLRPLYLMAKRGVELSFLPVDERGVLRYDQLESLVRPHTRAIVLTHGSNVTGNITDLALVSRFAKKHGLLLLVDAAQTVGALPIDVQALGIDILCFAGHKALLGPEGIGGIYVNPRLRLEPALVGGSGIHSYSEEMPADMPERLEAGTLNIPGICGLGGALAYLMDEGTFDNLKQSLDRELLLAKSFAEGVSSLPGIKLYGDFAAKERVPIVSLNINGIDSGSVSAALWEQFRICTRPGAHCAPLLHKALGTEQQGMVRFSFGYANTMEDVQTALAAVRQLAEGGCPC